MPDATEVTNPESNPQNPNSDLSSRVAALEAKINRKDQKSNRLGSLGVLLGAIATFLALPSLFLSSKSLLFPGPHTTLKEPDLQIQYEPTSMGLTFTVGIAASNDGNRDDIFHTPEASLVTASGKELRADNVVFIDERDQPLKPPLIVNPGTLKILVSPTFRYSLSDADSDKTAESLQISFPRDRGSVVKTRVCFKLGSKDLKEASPPGYGLSSSECAQVMK
jgi:hypothetical protein